MFVAKLYRPMDRDELWSYCTSVATLNVVRFPNCHECPEASGLGNLTKVKKLWMIIITTIMIIMKRTSGCAMAWPSGPDIPAAIIFRSA